MIPLLSKGNLVAILRNEEKWEILISLNDSFKIERFVYENNIQRLLKQLSEYYHRSWNEERKILSKEYNIQQKVPILINSNNILLFPTKSLNHPNCSLLNYYCINKYIKENKNTYIDFCIPYRNNKIIINQGITIQCDRRTIHNQMKRCEVIVETIRERNIIS